MKFDSIPKIYFQEEKVDEMRFSSEIIGEQLDKQIYQL